MLLSPFLVGCFGFRGLPKMMITSLVYHYLLHSKFWYYILGLASIKKFFVNSCLVLPYHGLYIISGTVMLLFLVLSCCYFPANYAIIFIKKKITNCLYCHYSLGFLKSLSKKVLAIYVGTGLCWTVRKKKQKQKL